ncbi:MAG: hypothetical protein EXR60_04735 [Dehalococcoidia bacterium]|nr:hypothetical protein [Dehalococcoidia bacterium]
MDWNIVGHTRALHALQRALATGTLAHSYILVGPPRTGKRTLALELAKALNCAEATSASRPCGRCQACRSMDAGKHPDVTTIALGSPLVSGEDDKKVLPRRYISIEQVRELQRTATLAPFAGRARVYLVDGADEMNAESANCLLKTLEEPPPRVLLVLLCSDTAEMLPTVLSRCQRLELGLLSEAAVSAALRQRWEAAPELAAQLAQACEGRLGWAVAALREPALLEARQLLRERLTAALTGNRSQRLNYAGELASLWSKDREEAAEALEALQGLYRGLLRARAGGEQGAGQSVLTPLPYQLQGLHILEIARALRSLALAREHLQQNVNARLALDVLFLGLPPAPATASQAAAAQGVVA